MIFVKEVKMKKINLLILPTFFVFMVGLGSLAYARLPLVDPDTGSDKPFIGNKLCTSGELEYKAVDGCDFTTNTCCDNGEWSGPDGKCCSGTKLPATQSCTKNGKTGTQKALYTCNHDTGEWVRGGWDDCVIDTECTPGETTTEGCPQLSAWSTKEKTCGNDGFWEDCKCPASMNPGYGPGGLPYCHGTLHTNMQQSGRSGCLNGYWVEETCSGTCCCSGDTPYLMSDGITVGCSGPRNRGYDDISHHADGGIDNYKSPCQCIIDDTTDHGGLRPGDY